MWIEDAGYNNKKRLCEFWTDPRTGKKRKKSIVLKTGSKKELKETQAKLLDEIQRLSKAIPINPTLYQVMQAYKHNLDKEVKPSTYRRNIYMAEVLQEMLGKDSKVEMLTAGYIKSRFLLSEKSLPTLNERLVRLKAILRWAYNNDLLSSTACIDKLKPFKEITPYRERIKDKFISRKELEKIIQEMTVPQWILLTIFLATSGLRIGEAAALTFDDIDYIKKELTINKSYDLCGHTTTTTKTLCSNRIIYMQPELFDVCVRLYKIYISQESNADGLVFPHPHGGHLGYAAYCKHLRIASEKAINRHITPHVLRHTHASILMEQGVPIETIARRLGHENSRVTKQIYLHVTEELKKKDNALLESVTFIPKNGRKMVVTKTLEFTPRKITL